MNGWLLGAYTLKRLLLSVELSMAEKNIIIQMLSTVTVYLSENIIKEDKMIWNLEFQIFIWNRIQKLECI